jgi:hypothetical protein
MSDLDVTRSADGLRLAGGDATMALTRLGPGVILVGASGHDTGQFGEAPFEWLEREMGRHGTVEVFVDMRAMFNAAQTVADRWSEWTGRHRTRIGHMSLLVGSKYVQMTVEVAKLFSRTGELMRIYTDDAAFEAAVRQSLGRGFTLEEVQRKP